MRLERIGDLDRRFFCGEMLNRDLNVARLGLAHVRNAQLSEPLQRAVGVPHTLQHAERSLILGLALALAEDRRRDISCKTKNGLEAARKRGKVGGRPRVIDDDKRAIILSRREKGESIRVIARVLDVSVGSVNAVLAEESAE